MRLENFTNPLKVLFERRSEQGETSLKDRFLGVQAGFVDLAKGLASGGKSLKALVGTIFQSRDHDIAEASTHLLEGAEKTAVGVKSIAKGFFQPRAVLEEHEKRGLFQGIESRPLPESSEEMGNWYATLRSTHSTKIDDDARKYPNIIDTATEVVTLAQTQTHDTISGTTRLKYFQQFYTINAQEALVNSLVAAALFHTPSLEESDVRDIMKEVMSQGQESTVFEFIEKTLEACRKKGQTEETVGEAVRPIEESLDQGLSTAKATTTSAASSSERQKAQVERNIALAKEIASEGTYKSQGSILLIAGAVETIEEGPISKNRLEEWLASESHLDLSSLQPIFIQQIRAVPNIEPEKWIEELKIAIDQKPATQNIHDFTKDFFTRLYRPKEK